MKKITTILTKGLLTLGLAFSVQGTFAATFTAVASGNWSDATTWESGSIPGFDLFTDDVIIPEDFIVNMDIDVAISGLLANLNVDGTLSNDTGSELIITNGSISGEGTIDLDYIEFNDLASMTFTGTANIQKFVQNSGSLILDAQLTVEDTLRLNGGNVVIGDDADLEFATNSVILVKDGLIEFDGGTLTGEESYTLVYTGESKITGAEALGDGLKDIYIQLDDNDQELTLVGEMVIGQNFYQQTGDIDLNGQDLTINGNFVASSDAEIIGNEDSDLTINSGITLTNALVFEEGSEVLNNFQLIGSDSEEVVVELSTDLMVMGDILIDEVVLIVNAGSELRLSEGSTIMIDNADFMFVDEATFNGDAEYNVSFRGESNTAGRELGASGLNDLTVMFDDNDQALTITTNVTVNGILMMEEGDLDVTGYDLTLMGDIMSDMETVIMSDEMTTLNIGSEESFTGVIYFDEEMNELDELIINLDESASVMIGSDVNVEDLIFVEGMLILLDANLEIATDGSLTGFDADSYISTEGNGSLKMTLISEGDYMIFPVGNEDGYSPAMVRINSGTTGTFGVNVMQGVLVDGSIGTDVSTSESLVNRTWNVFEGTGSSSDIDLTVMWSADMEVNGFDNEDAYITHYVDGNWDVSATTAAMFDAETEMYSMERLTITSLSPFAVKDNNSSLSIDEAGTVEFAAWPNPTTGVLNLDLSQTSGDVNFSLINNQGQVVTNYGAEQAGAIITFDLSNLPKGMYFIQVVDGENVTTKRIVKS